MGKIVAYIFYLQIMEISSRVIFMFNRAQRMFINDSMKEDDLVSMDEYSEFMKYTTDCFSRELLWKKFENPHDIFLADDETKQKLNKLTTKIVRYEMAFMESDVYKNLKEDIELRATTKDSEIPDFLLNEEEKERKIEMIAGWYQNAKGDLFHYDGVIWDKVPNDKLKELEYLG